MKVRLRYGREAIAETPYKRFGYSYLIHLPKDGIFQKSNCFQNIKSEFSLGSIILKEKYNKYIVEGYGVCELGIGNFQRFRPYRNFIFTLDGRRQSSSIIEASDVRTVFLINLSEISPGETFHLNIQDDEQFNHKFMNLKDLNIYFFTEFAAPDTIEKFNISYSGNVSYFWTIEPFLGSLQLFADLNSQIKFILNYSFAEWTPVILNFNYDCYLRRGAYARVEIYAWDDLVARWRAQSGASRGEINLTADAYQNTIIQIILKSVDGVGFLRLGKFIFANQNAPCIWR